MKHYLKSVGVPMMMFCMGAFLILLFAPFPKFRRQMEKESQILAVIARPLNRDLGFKHHSPYRKVGRRASEVFELEVTGDDSLFAAAGVESGDIVTDYGIFEFYQALEVSRGEAFAFRVVEGGDGPSLNQRTSKTIKVQVSKAVPKGKPGTPVSNWKGNSDDFEMEKMPWHEEAAFENTRLPGSQ